MSMMDNPPVCPHTCFCGRWSPCPCYPWTAFAYTWYRVGSRYAEHCEGQPPTRWQRVREWFTTRVPRARVVA